MPGAQGGCGRGMSLVSAGLQGKTLLPGIGHRGGSGNRPSRLKVSERRASLSPNERATKAAWAYSFGGGSEISVGAAFAGFGVNGVELTLSKLRLSLRVYLFVRRLSCPSFPQAAILI
jgi:hypothetical protein